MRHLAGLAGFSISEMLDFSANINPLGVPPWLDQVMEKAAGSLARYPDPEYVELTGAVASRMGVSSAEVTMGNGSSELLYALPRALGMRRAILPAPSYQDYSRACRLAGWEVEFLCLKEEDGFHLDFDRLEKKLEGGEVVILGHPNNPTGKCCDAARLRQVCRRFPDVFFLVDESFGGFVDGFDSLTTDRPVNAGVLYSFTKLHAIPGLRLGCLIANEVLSCRVKAGLPPWTVNALAEAVGMAAMQDQEFAGRTRALVCGEREWLTQNLPALGGMKVYPGEANYLLVRLDDNRMDAAELTEKMLRRGIALRFCGDFEGLDARFFRVAVRTRAENERLVNGLSEARQ